MSDCQGCLRKSQCLTAREREGKAKLRRRVYLSDVRKAKILAGQAGREWRRQNLRVRGRIEAKFDEQMNRHGLRRARPLPGTGKGHGASAVLLNVITVNLKQTAKLMKPGAYPVAALLPA